jgi:hypothetical protein
MRTHLIRLMFAAALLISFAATPALAQSLTRGKVVDSTGKPVQDAVVTFVAQFVTMSRTAKTDAKGEYLIIGSAVGAVCDHGDKGRGSAPPNCRRPSSRGRTSR